MTSTSSCRSLTINRFLMVSIETLSFRLRSFPSFALRSRRVVIIHFFGNASTKDISFVVHHPPAIRILVGKHTKSHGTVGKQQDAGVRLGIAKRSRLVSYLDCFREEARECVAVLT